MSSSISSPIFACPLFSKYFMVSKVVHEKGIGQTVSCDIHFIIFMFSACSLLLVFIPIFAFWYSSIATLIICVLILAMYSFLQRIECQIEIKVDQDYIYIYIFLFVLNLFAVIDMNIFVIALARVILL